MILFVAVTFAWSWAWWLPLVVAGRRVEQADPWPTEFPGLLGASVAVTVVWAAVVTALVIALAVSIRQRAGQDVVRPGCPVPGPGATGIA